MSFLSLPLIMFELWTRNRKNVYSTVASKLNCFEKKSNNNLLLKKLCQKNNTFFFLTNQSLKLFPLNKFKIHYLWLLVGCVRSRALRFLSTEIQSIFAIILPRKNLSPEPVFFIHFYIIAIFLFIEEREKFNKEKKEICLSTFCTTPNFFVKIFNVKAGKQINHCFSKFPCSFNL